LLGRSIPLRNNSKLKTPYLFGLYSSR